MFEATQSMCFRFKPNHHNQVKLISILYKIHCMTYSIQCMCFANQKSFPNRYLSSSIPIHKNKQIWWRFYKEYPFELQKIINRSRKGMVALKQQPSFGLCKKSERKRNHRLLLLCWRRWRSWSRKKVSFPNK